MARRGKSRTIRRTGCLFWIFILLIIVVIFLYRGKGSFKETINSIILLFKSERKEETLVKKEVGGKKRVQIPEEKITPAKPELKEEKPVKQPSEEKGKTAEDEQIEEKSIMEKTQVSETQKKPVELPKSKEKLKPVENKETKKWAGKETRREAGDFHTRISTIYYALVNTETGKISLAGVKKKVRYKDSPITKTIQLLLNGPEEIEEKRGFKSFIPQGTKLISASLNNNHLILNFNENFENNYLGRQAIEIQLKQIILTCFEFDEVRSISILINGKRKRYITGEGIPLKESYTRSDLNTL